MNQPSDDERNEQIERLPEFNFSIRNQATTKREENQPGDETKFQRTRYTV